MSATDAGFLYLERRNAPLHISSVIVLERPIQAHRLSSRLDERLGENWRLAQRPVPVPFALDHPAWEDAPRFDVRDHVFEWGLPSPGGDRELLDLAGRLIATPLDRERPLWEMHVVHGLEGGRSALVQKVHHCMIDGVAATRMLESLLDVPDPLQDGAQLEVRSAPERTRRTDARVRYTLMGTIRAALPAVGRPAAAARLFREAAGAAGLLALDTTPRLPWNAPVGPRRRLAFTRLPLAGAKQIRKVHATTINDVVLAALAGGLGRYLRATGSSPTPTLGEMRVTAMIPVNLRSAIEERAPGNRISAVLVPLQVGEQEERERLLATRRTTERLKRRAAWTWIGALLDFADALPPPLVAMLARGAPLSRLASVIATNVPGPAGSRSLCGARIEAVYPFVPIAAEMGLGLAVFSYDGWLDVGLNADPVLVPDLEKLLHCIEESFDLLWKASAIEA